MVNFKINNFKVGKYFYIVDKANFTDNGLEILHLNSNLSKCVNMIS